MTDENDDSKKVPSKKKLDLGSIKKIQIERLNPNELLQVMAYTTQGPYTMNTSTCCTQNTFDCQTITQTC